MFINYVSSPCGSGKTHQIIERGRRWALHGRRVLILQPTKELINKTIEHELQRGPNVPPFKVFHGGTVADGVSVARELTEFSKTVGDDGLIVFATHQVLPYIGFLANKNSWHVLVDEEIQVLRYASHQIPHTHPILTDHVQLEPCNGIFSRIVCQNEKAVADIGKNKDEDEIHERLADIARTLTSRPWQSFVNTEQYHRLKAGTQKTLAIHSVLSPTVLDDFATVFMAAANFQDTALYQVWSEKGVEFVEDSDFGRSLRFNTHSNGGLITILFADEKPWSRKRQNTRWPDRDHATTLSLIARAAANRLGDAPFVWQANKGDLLDHPFGNNARLPNMPHGLNDHSGINNIVFLSALNPRSDHFSFLESQGLDADAVRRAIYFSTAYQSVMRTSIRNPDNTEPKIIIVPDRGLAEFLQSVFPGSRIEKLDAGIPDDGVIKKRGRPRKHHSDSVRLLEYRRRKKQELLAELASVRHYDSSGMLRNEKGIEIITNFVSQPRPYQGTIYSDKRSAKPTGYAVCSDPDGFSRWLKDKHSRRVPAKEAAGLISPAIFDPGRSENQSRGRGNIVLMKNLWLDFEDGDLRPDEIPNLFPDIRMVVMNTFQNTNDKPRFRVFVPLSRPLTPDTYEALWDIMANKLEDAGYQVLKTKAAKSKPGKRRSGLDGSKRAPTSLFYLPCQAQDPSQSFFQDYNGPERRILDPETYLEHTIIRFQPPALNPTGGTERPIDQARVDDATNEWRRSGQFPEQGNDRFFDYAMRLRAAGMDLADIESRLRSEAQFGRTPHERQNQIPSIITSLRRSHRRAG